MKLHKTYSENKISLPNAGIYFIKNNITGRVYIGSSSNLRRRFEHHRWLILNNNHHNSYLQRSINKYGVENFKFEVICKCPSEKYYLEKLENYFFKIITLKYNQEGVAVNNTGRVLSEETKKKISKANKGNTPPNKGVPMSQEQKDKISKANKGKCFRENFKQTEEVKLKISISKKGKKRSKESIRKQKEYLKNNQRTFSKEMRKKCSEASKNYWKEKGISKQYKEIIKLLETGNYKQIEIAKLLNCSPSQVTVAKKYMKNEL